jgi:D-methionine transport system permease protein
MRSALDPAALAALLVEPTLETIYMTAASTFLASVLGFPLGAVLRATDADGVVPRPLLNMVLSRTVNLLRSFPFIILMILVFPLSRILVGTSIGTTAAIVPLSIAAAPFVARVVESALKEVDPGVVLAARSMGSTPLQIVFKVLVPEALPALVSGLALTVINLIGYSAMAGAVGGGGLGDLAIRYGYQRFRTDVMVAAVAVIVVLVESVQFAGTAVSRRMLAKR